MMYCVSGFRLFEDFLEIIRDAANLQEPISNDYFSPDVRDKAIARIIDMENDIVFRNQVWCEYLLQTYFLKKCTRIHACSPEGMIQEISPKSICVPTRVCQKFDPHNSIVSFIEFAASSLDTYPLVDRETWTVNIPKYIDRLKEKLSQNRYAGKAQTGTQMRSEVEILMKISEAEKIQHLNGWSICIREEHFVDNGNALLKHLVSNLDKKVKIGSSQADISRAIVKGFDNSEFKTKSEAKTLYAEKVSFRKFDMSWAKASEERPDISKSGPKKQT